MNPTQNRNGRQAVPVFLFVSTALSVKGRVDCVDVFLVHFFGCNPQRLAEALEMHNLTRAQKANGIVDVRIVGKAENVVIGGAGFLLCCFLIRTTNLQ